MQNPVYVFRNPNDSFYKAVNICMCMHTLRTTINQHIMNVLNKMLGTLNEHMYGKCKRILNYSFRDYIINEYINRNIGENLILNIPKNHMNKQYYEKIFHVAKLNEKQQNELLSIDITPFNEYYLLLLSAPSEFTLFTQYKQINSIDYIEFVISFLGRAVKINLQKYIYESLIIYRKIYCPDEPGTSSDIKSPYPILDNDMKNIFILLFKYYSIYRLGNVISLENKYISHLGVTSEFMSCPFDNIASYYGMFHNEEKYYSPSISNFTSYITRKDETLLIISAYHDMSIIKFIRRTIKKLVEFHKNSPTTDVSTNKIIVMLPDSYRYLERFTFSKFFQDLKLNYQMQTLMLEFTYKYSGLHCTSGHYIKSNEDPNSQLSIMYHIYL